MAYQINVPESIQSNDAGWIYNVYTANTTAVVITTIGDIQEKESGLLAIYYSSIDNAGSSANKVKQARYKKVNGVVTVANVTLGFSNSDTQNTTDCNIVASGGNVNITVTGAGTVRDVKHSVQVIRNLVVFGI